MSLAAFPPEKAQEEDPGTEFHGLHWKWLGYEEFSYASEKGTEKRVDSKHSHGFIERLSGIPDIRIGSPLSNILNKKSNKPIVPVTEGKELSGNVHRRIFRSSSVRRLSRARKMF